ncbi:MAG: hypothetical protein F4Z15_08250 [Gammaproteobacteria bacterium]|nr:hypothetical protein [Gammaproteobacteria bacterium]MYD76526.1 hypothetical protein [Gammaproteobacteria bacterium]
MRTGRPELPAAYELVEIEESDDLRRLAAGMACDGRREGTLIWLKRQLSGRGWDDSPWYSQEGDLHCAVLLEPEFERRRYGEIILVAAVSLGNALALHLSPMIALGYDWPDRLVIANHVVGRIWAECGHHPKPWLSVSCSVNLLDSPEDYSISAISVREAEGTTELDAGTLLQSFAREFITGINAWSEEGMPSLVDKWRIRGNRPGTPCTVGALSGTVRGIDEAGNLLVEAEAGHQEKLVLESRVREFTERTQ